MASSKSPANRSVGPSIPPPPGYIATLATAVRPTNSSARKSGQRSSSSPRSAAPQVENDVEKQITLRKKKAWDLAYSGAKQIPMNLVMMYMSGNSLQIFSIFITVMMMWNPLKALAGLSRTFSALESGSTLVNLAAPKIVFVAFQCANICLAIYKCQQMGLLPTTESDWLAFRTAPKMFERAVGRL